MPPPVPRKPKDPVPAGPNPVPAPPPLPNPIKKAPPVVAPLAPVTIIVERGKHYASADEWAASGALKTYSKRATDAAVTQRYSAGVSANEALALLGPGTLNELVGLMVMNSPEEKKIGHVAIRDGGGISITVSSLFARDGIKWKMDEASRSKPKVLSASRILSAWFFYWLESVGMEKTILSGISGRIGLSDIPRECSGFVLNITGILQKKEMAGLVDRYYLKELMFIHFLHHFQMDKNRNDNLPFATGVMESCLAQKPNFDSGTQRANYILAAIPAELHSFIKFRNDDPTPGFSDNDAKIDSWFLNYNSGDSVRLKPSKPVTKEQASFKERLMTSLMLENGVD